MSKDYLVPIVTTIVGALVVWMQEWLHTRDRYHRRKNALSEAGDLVKFVEDWLHAQEAVCPPQELEPIKRRAREQLEEIYARWSSAQEESAPALRVSFARAFLLYRPTGTSGWIAHVVFYLYLAFVAFLTLGVILDWKTGELPATIGIYVLLLAIFLALRAWAVHFRPGDERRSAEPTVARVVAR